MSQSGIYSENKLVWWHSREGDPKAPKQVQLILSDLCNQDCHFCAYRMSGYSSNELFVGDSVLAQVGHNNPMRFIDTQRALKLVDEIKAAGALSIQFTGGGEPTVHPAHATVFLRTLNQGLRAALVSNGVRWSAALIQDILPRFDWVRVSIDAASAESYAKIRRCPTKHWDRAWGHVISLAEAIRSRKSDCVLGLGFVVTPESYKEIPGFARLAKLAGAHNCRYSAMFSPEDEKPFVEIYDEVRGLIDQAKEFESPGFSVHDNFGSRFEDLRQHAPDYKRCGYQHYTAYIGGDLKAYRCCVLAYNRRGLVAGGDLSKTTFDEFWKSQQRLDDMEALDARGCERCQFNEKNRALNYVRGNTESDTSSRHIEWP